MKVLFWIVVAIVAAVAASFAASNRAVVALGLWPLPFVAELPLYLALVGALLIGVVLGALLVWITGRRRRRAARRHGRRVVVLERELAATQAQLPAAAEQQQPSPPPSLPRAARG
jgi:lipopolysaccharide assembly protein A